MTDGSCACGLADLGDPQRVGGAGLAEGDAGQDHDVFAAFGEAFLQGEPDRSGDGFAHAVNLGGDHGVHAPDDREAAGGLLGGGEAHDRGFRAFPGGAPCGAAR